MQCVHSIEADRYAHDLGVIQMLESQKQNYINNEAERVISSTNSAEYQFLIDFTLDEINLLTEYDRLVNQIINANGDQIIDLKNKLRAVMKQAAVHYVEEKMKNDTSTA